MENAARSRRRLAHMHENAIGVRRESANCVNETAEVATRFASNAERHLQAPFRDEHANQTERHRDDDRGGLQPNSLQFPHTP